MLRLLLYVCCLVAISLANEEGEKHGNYLLVIPSILRPGRSLDISVSILKTTTPVTINAKVYYNDTGNKYVDKGSTTPKPTQRVVSETTQSIVKQGIVSLQIPADATRNQYSVWLSGTGEIISFENETIIRADTKTLSIFIQTDKGTYKPGTLVRYRVMGVYANLMPYKGTFDITIEDPKKNIVQQWLNISSANGVVSKQLQLSEQPVLGNWIINVKTPLNAERKKSATIQVAEYVLPKFEVIVDMPPFMLAETKTLPIKVSAIYTYGKKVNGKAIVSIKIQTYSTWEMENYGYTILNKTIQLKDGVAEIMVTREELLSLAGYRRCYSSMCYVRDVCVAVYAQIEAKLMHKTIFVHAEVTEELTGNMLSANATTIFRPFPVKMKFLGFSSNTFKPGMSWKGVLQLSRIDDSNIKASDFMDGSGNPDVMQVTFTCSNASYYNSEKVMKNYTITTSGLIDLDYTPGSNIVSCSIQAVYKYAQTNWNIKKFLSSEGHSVQITAIGLTGTVMVGSEVDFKVTTTQIVAGFHYQILSKGLIVETKYITTSGENTTIFGINFDVDLCRKISPNARLLVWFITSNGEMIVDTMNLKVDGALSANEVSLDFSDKEVKPGSDVSLTVHAEAGSYVGVLAVDKSTRLMGGPRNELSEDDIMSELRQYDSSGGNYPISYYRWWYPIPTGGKDTYQLLQNAGVKVLTDATIFKEYIPPPPVFSRGGPRGPSGPDIMFGAPRGPAGEAGQRGQAGGPAMMPDMAMDDGIEMSVEKADAPLQEPQRIRTEFPETWIWTEEVIKPDGTVTIQTTAPDTITSWVASAFAMSETAGMGVTKDMTMLNVMKPFFISMNLPYSVIRGEEVALQVTVFNYLPNPLTVVVTLEASSELQVRHPNDVLPTINTDVERTITVPGGDGKMVSFWIVPVKIGQTMLSVKARSTVAADQVQRFVLVQPEGEAIEFVRNVFVNNKDYSVYRENMTVEFPPMVVADSERAVFTLTGDIMGPTIKGLDRLLRIPYGCGEQNMLKFAPNIYILQYLGATDQLTDAIKSKTHQFIESGYQRELTYLRNDGSFSAFGDGDDAGSMWLTAFVIRCFHQAKPYILIDQKIINTAATWIVRHQNKSGSFMEPPMGRVIHTAMQGGSSKGIGLTAYVVATLLENVENITDLNLKRTVESAINKALNRLESQLPNITSDAYALSLVTYTLTLANRRTASQALAALEALVTVEGNKRYWKRDIPSGPMPNIYRPIYYAPSYDIEMTAYGLMIYTKLGRVNDGIGVASWLASQRNSLGGYRSTQDTVVALQGLSDFEVKLGTKDAQDMDVSLIVDGNMHPFTKIVKDNVMVQQSIDIPAAISNVQMTASGTGIAMFQMAIHYHQTESDDLNGIELTVTSDTNENGQVITKACGRWLKDEESGMVVLQINQLTAYSPLTDTIISSSTKSGVKRYEIDDRTLTLYLDELPKEEKVCITVTSVNVSPVSNLKPAVVIMFPYYSPENKKAAYYLPDKLRNASMCDTCPECCNGITTTQQPVIVKDNCIGSPCINGQCVDDMNTYMCVCNVGFTGRNCQQKIVGDGNIKVSQIRDRENGASHVTYTSVLFTTLLMFLVTLL